MLGGREKSIPTDTWAFLLRLHTNSFREEESGLALETLSLWGGLAQREQRHPEEAQADQKSSGNC